MKTFNDLIAEAQPRVTEIFPWDLESLLADDSRDTLLIDIREPAEFATAHISGAINVPRGILESAVEYDYEDTLPELVEARDREVILICRSGNRTVLAADTLQTMGFKRVVSVKTGMRGWADDDRPVVDQQGNAVDPDDAFEYFNQRPRSDQMRPAAA